jgi:hypothetical protein
MTIHERMVPRSEREKDLLKYGRSQERQRIIKLLETEFCEPEFKGDSFTPADNLLVNLGLAIELIKGETNE